MPFKFVIFPVFIMFLATPVYSIELFPASLSVQDITCENGLIINGVNAFDVSGSGIAAVGDMNGDNLNDMAVSAHRASVFMNGSNLLRAGKVHIIFGKNGERECPIRLSNLSADTGITLNGTDRFRFLGQTIASGGDFNEDGFGDLIIDEASNRNYVIYGGPDLSSLNYLPEDLDVNSGFQVFGAGGQIAHIGDINGDGVSDIGFITSDAFIGSGNEGQAIVIFGTGQQANADINISDLDGTNGFLIQGEANFGNSLDVDIDSAGDVNGDGIDDLILGISEVDGNRGRAYLIYGTRSGFNHPLELSSIDGINGTVFQKSNAFGTGERVSSAGDLNNDGIDDVMVGVDFPGRAHIVFGKRGGLPFPVQLDALDVGEGLIASPYANGSVLTKAGDMNNDGISDIAISHPDIDHRGAVYVLYGTNSWADGYVDLTGLNGNNGFAITGEEIGGSFGWAVASLGDVNGDGGDDLIMGAPGMNRSAGVSYVVFGVPDDSDGDGVNDNDDLCPDTVPDEAVDSAGCSDAQVDGDSDGVCNDGAVSNGPSACLGVDVCPETVIPEGVPTVKHGTNRWALVDDDSTFDTISPKNKKSEGPGRSYSMTDTEGCSCEQIIAEMGLGKGNKKHGCSIGAMDKWIALPK